MSYHTAQLASNSESFCFCLLMLRLQMLSKPSRWRPDALNPTCCTVSCTPGTMMSPQPPQVSGPAFHPRHSDPSHRGQYVLFKTQTDLFPSLFIPCKGSEHFTTWGSYVIRRWLAPPPLSTLHLTLYLSVLGRNEEWSSRDILTLILPTCKICGPLWQKVLCS